MNIAINHSLDYQYSSEISLDPHIIYLFPKLNESLALKRYDLKIEPLPSHIYQNIDLEGNIQSIAFFKNKTKRLTVRANFEVETLPFNPFDFVFFPFECSSLPFSYSDTDLRIISGYLSKTDVTTLVDQAARSLASEVAWSTAKFLMRLCDFINKSFSYSVREEGPPQSPETTLLKRNGSCRDYSVFFIACCQAMGLAARFVSGYYYSKTLEKNYLHAWAEVYLPGGGWRAFDPTQNNAVSNLHIPLASSLFPEKIGPVTGTFRGKSSSILETTVIVKNIDGNFDSQV
jgi:transglutaminase-like putative cysteine protease